ncbi:MAG: helix-turn-helix domain-containing protein [Eubacteriales bacterium]|nr:helix-turn-helix domain-containing protein [Eubacteriales bacterium]
MDYLTAAQAAALWGVQPRVAQRYCAQGRVPGAQKHGREWLIPARSAKPGDPRKAPRPADSPRYLPHVFLSSAIPMPRARPEKVLDTLEPPLRAQYEAEFAYLRGDFRPILTYARAVLPDASTYLCACAIGASAAVSLGDYPAFTDFMARLERVKARCPGTEAALFAEAALATEAVSLYAPENAPPWLQRGELSRFPQSALPWLLYLYVKYLHNMRRFEAALGAAQAGLMFLPHSDEITCAELYLRLMCSASCRVLKADARANEYLADALETAMPHGFITPFAETVTAYGGELEQRLRSRWPAQHAALTGRLENTWKNWMSFHNQLARDRVTLVLNLQEYTLAGMLARGATYAEAARRMHLSIGRIRNLASVIYAKLCVSGKSELSPYIL